MNVFGNIKAWFVHTEQDVVAFMLKVWNEQAVIESEIQSAAAWIVRSGLPALVDDINKISPFVAVIGTATGHPELTANMAALNTAMVGIQAFAAAANSGSITADQVVAGYGSLKNASAAAAAVVSSAAQVVANTPPVTPTAAAK